MAESVDIRIHGGLVVTMDPARREIEGGVVEVTGRTIAHVGPAATAGPAAAEVDASGMLVLPGLVNTHVHTAQHLARGLGDDVDLLTWLRDRIWPFEVSLGEADVACGTLACAAEQIRNGVTTFADPGGHHVDAVGRSIATSGLRAYLGLSSLDEDDGLPAGMARPTADLLALEDALADRWHGAADGRIRFSYTVRTIFNCSDELIAESASRTRALGSVLQMHIAEIPEENEHSLRTRGLSTVRHLDRLGVLDCGFLGAHGVFVDGEELGLLAGAGAAVSHNLASNLKVLGIPRVADMLDAGIVVAIGTDGAPANNRMSLLDEMWAAGLLQKGVRRDPTVLPARRVLEMATIDGARALRWSDRIGSLEPGKEADLVLVDLHAANTIAVVDPVAALATSAKTENVVSVMCAGAWLLRDRRIVSFDEDEVLAEAARRGPEVVARRQAVVG